jgi:hypothetical protein
MIWRGSRLVHFGKISDISARICRRQNHVSNPKLAAIFLAGAAFVNCFRLLPQRAALAKLAMFQALELEILLNNGSCLRSSQAAGK